MGPAGARRYWPVWIAVAAAALWAAVRVLGLERGFPLVPLISYTPYASVAALLATGVAIALRNWAAASVAAIATALLLAAVLPRAVGGSAEPLSGTPLAVLSVNVHHGTADAAALVAIVERRDPDVLAVQELTPRFARELDRAGLRRALPHAVVSVRRGATGGGLYSRLPLRRLPEGESFAFRMPRAALPLPGGREARIVDVHPYPPGRGNVDIWAQGLRSLPAAGAGSPWVLAGDFNATLDHAELRDVLDDGYRDAAEVVGRGLVPTWPASRVRLPPVTIDHVLADRRLAVAGYSVEDVPGSDHRAVFALLSVPY